MDPLHAKGYQGQIPPQAKAPQHTEVDKKVQELKKIWGNFNIVPSQGTAGLQVKFTNIPIDSKNSVLSTLQKQKGIDVKEHWQVHNDKDGTCSITLRNFEVSKLLGYTKYTKPAFDKLMEQIKQVKEAHGDILASKEEKVIPKEEKSMLRKYTVEKIGFDKLCPEEKVDFDTMTEETSGFAHINKHKIDFAKLTGFTSTGSGEIYTTHPKLSDHTNLFLSELATELDSTLTELEGGSWRVKGTRLKMFESLQIFTRDELNPHALKNIMEKAHPLKDSRSEAASNILWELDRGVLSNREKLKSAMNANAIIITLNGIQAQGGSAYGTTDFSLITFKFLSALHNIPIQTYFTNDTYSFLFIPYKDEHELNQISKVLRGIVGMIKENPVGAFLAPLINKPGTTFTVNRGSFDPSDDEVYKCRYDQFSNGFKLTIDYCYDFYDNDLSNYLSKYCSRAFENQFPGKLTQTREGNSIILIVTL